MPSRRVDSGEEEKRVVDAERFKGSWKIWDSGRCGGYESSRLVLSDVNLLVFIL